MDGPVALRLGTWNIHLGLEIERVLDVARSGECFHEVDVVLLQEASSAAGRSDSQRIAAALGTSYRALQRNVDNFHGRVRGLGVVWNESTFRLDAAELIPLPHLRPSPFARRHHYLLRPLGLRPRSTLMLEGRAGALSVRMYDIHLSPVGFALQTEQLATILRDASHRPACDVLLLAGDFNSLRIDRRRWAAWFAARKGQGFRNVTSGVPWTFRSPTLPIRQKLDHVLLRAAQASTSATEAPLVAGSDHLPVFARLSVEQPVCARQ